jgi:membrane associated rhomboid family serine protease
LIQRSRPPVVTLILIAANLIAAFGVLGIPDLVERFGFRSDAPSFQAAVTSLFLHANVLHLLGNMVFLAAVGAAVEMASGSVRFASVYFVSGLVGVFAHYLMTKSAIAPAPFIGASGAIAGCAGYYSFRYTGMKVPIYPGKEISVMMVTAFWVALQIVGAFIRLGETSGTAYWAHLGGFAAGIVLSLVFRAPDLGQARMGHALIKSMGERGPAAVAATAQHHLKTHPKDAKALEELANAFNDLDEQTREADALLSLLAVAEDEQQPTIVSRILDAGKIGKLPTWRRTLLAERFKDSNRDLSIQLLETVICEPDDGQRPEAILALAALEREAHPSRAEDLLRELATSYPLHPAMEVARKRGWVS